MRSHILNYKEIQPDIAQTLLISSLHADDFNTGVNKKAHFILVNLNSKIELFDTKLENQVY